MRRYEFSRQLVAHWARLGPRFLPFADVATPDLPLSRLLRLSLFQVSVGMALALLIGALNRVMIVELHVPAALVAIMVALPVLYAPARALIGFRSDHHRSALGWRRVPFIWMGTLIQFGGLAMMPFALLVLSGAGQSQDWPTWVGPAGAALAFLLVGAGLHTTQTAGLALATDLTPQASHPKVVGLMYVSLLAGTVVSASAFGWFLADFSPGRLVQVIQACAVVTLILNAVAMWKQEPMNAQRSRQPREDVNFVQAWQRYTASPEARQRLWVLGLGTMAFAMQDVLLEPYGGQVLGLSVGATTWLTATLALGGLMGFGLASKVLSRGVCPVTMTRWGAAAGIPAFAAVSAASLAPGSSEALALFVLGVFGIGLGGGVFSHGTLTLTMKHAPSDQVGLALGAWGAVQATAAGAAVALGGLGADISRAVLAGVAEPAASAASGYAAVYVVEIVLLCATLWVLHSVRSSTQQVGQALSSPWKVTPH